MVDALLAEDQAVFILKRIRSLCVQQPRSTQEPGCARSDSRGRWSPHNQVT